MCGEHQCSHTDTRRGLCGTGFERTLSSGCLGRFLCVLRAGFKPLRQRPDSAGESVGQRQQRRLHPCRSLNHLPGDGLATRRPQEMWLPRPSQGQQPLAVTVTWADGGLPEPP